MQDKSNEKRWGVPTIEIVCNKEMAPVYYSSRESDAVFAILVTP